jgi:alkanesulfonate monooxygenase SsuD/methylene tetrahydromethanopterin reductase-like flavin-dependent oxidoreductase (luciferase family)
MPFEFDVLFEVQVPKPWSERKERDRFHEAIEQAVFAELMGFRTAWIVEHHFLTQFAHSSAPDAVLGALAMRTSTMRLGFGVALLPHAVNHPIRVAERAAMVDVLSDGRVEVGTGRSSSPYQLEAFGTDVATTREQWEEAIKLLPRLWTEEDVSHHGRFLGWVDRITVVPRPLQRPHPPLWVASTQPDTCRLAGEKGIGLLMPALNSPDVLRTQVEAYKAAVAAPIDPVGLVRHDQCALFALSFCADDDDAARRRGGAAALWYVNTITEIYQNDWRGTPLEEVPESYRPHVEARRRGASGAGNFAAERTADAGDEATIAQYIDSGAFCVGDVARVTENVRRYRAIGGDRLVCVMQLGDLGHDEVMRSLELYGTAVIPAIRADEAAEVTTPSTARR